MRLRASKPVFAYNWACCWQPHCWLTPHPLGPVLLAVVGGAATLLATKLISQAAGKAIAEAEAKPQGEQQGGPNKGE